MNTAQKHKVRTLSVYIYAKKKKKRLKSICSWNLLFITPGGFISAWMFSKPSFIQGKVTPTASHSFSHTHSHEEVAEHTHRFTGFCFSSTEQLHWESGRTWKKPGSVVGQYCCSHFQALSWHSNTHTHTHWLGWVLLLSLHIWVQRHYSELLQDMTINILILLRRMFFRSRYCRTTDKIHFVDVFSTNI